MSKTLKIVAGDIVKYQGSKSGFELVEGKDKVTQDTKMIFLTSVRRLTGLGCGLKEVIGRDTMRPVAGYLDMPAVFDFQNRIAQGLYRLQEAQKAYQVGSRTNAELIYDFSAVRIWPNQEDPRNFSWQISIRTDKGRDSVQISGRTS